MGELRLGQHVARAGGGGDLLDGDGAAVGDGLVGRDTGRGGDEIVFRPLPDQIAEVRLGTVAAGGGGGGAERLGEQDLTLMVPELVTVWLALV